MEQKYKILVNSGIKAYNMKQKEGNMGLILSIWQYH